MSVIAPTPESTIASVPRPFASGLRRATVVSASVLIATLLSTALRPFIANAIFVFYYASVIVCALYAGFAAGVVTVLVAAVLANYIAWTAGVVPLGDTANIIGTTAFVAMGVALSAIAESTRRARAAAEQHATRLAEQAVELEAQQEEAQQLTEELEVSNVELEAAMQDAEAARDAAVASEERLKLLDQASRVLSSSLDHETTVAAAARLAIPAFADWCAVDLLVDGEIRQLALAHVDEEKATWARQLNAKYRPSPDALSGTPLVISTGVSRLIGRVTPEMLAGTARDAEHLAILESLTIHSVMIVPMSARGITIGALTFVSTRPDLEYDDASLAFAQQFAQRAATAIDNARLYRAALAANEAKANFLATMSHELRTPLTAIIGYEELLAEGISGEVNENQRQQLNRIRVSATHLLSLIDEILLYARVEAGRESVRIEPVVAKGVVDDALAYVAPSAAERGLTLDAESIDPSLMLRTDVGKLRQMLLNLLANAVKFTPRGAITVRVGERGDAIAFEVNDTGIGIDRGDLEHIFDPFWQVEQTTTRKIGGSGLGLSVTRKLARLLGGDVTVASEPSAGSTFTIMLPKSPVSPVESRNV